MRFRLSSPQKTFVRLVILVGFIIVIGYDLASTLQNTSSTEAIPVSQLIDDGVPPDYTTKVSFIRSDDSCLSNPVPLDEELTLEQYIDMVYALLDMSGELTPLLFEGAHVVIKPNVVEFAELGNGVNTDPRMIEGLIRWMEDRGPDGLQYTVAEAAGGWISSEMRHTKYYSSGTSGDGYREAGYTDMQQRLADDGITMDIVDANFGSYDNPLEGIRYVPVPEWIDFPEASGYWVHEVLLNADVLINTPVMKIHNPQITVCLKNYIGIAAGAKYGTYKGVGGPDPGDPRLHKDYPTRNSVEKEIVDLASLAPADFSLVDAVICKERAKTASSPSVRRNMMIAGTDMVAIDTICSLLMGLNPDDVSHLYTAAREGFGTMDLDRITVEGEHTIEESAYYFVRTPQGDSGNRGHFGMSNRIWLLNAASGTDIDTSYLSVPDAELIGIPGSDGWTEPIQFSDDIIDFEAYYGATNDNVYYAFSWLTVPEEQDAELWISHDESCAVWIGGEQVYYKKVRYQETALPDQSSATIHLTAGRHPMIVKLVDTSRTAPFVLNICRILPDTLPAGKATYTNLRTSSNYRRYEGTRVLGLKYDTGTASTTPNWDQY